ncbi:MAG: CPBP family intramembrane metalloprotease [Prolixibacteraceae bacterium]|nr:CPBP family intramembrane metalloprotease [Prolixibacteraceae bacterium]
MNTTEQKTIMRKYKRPFLFYLLSTAIPWSLWFLAGYFSHIEPFTKTLEWAVGICSILGLAAPAVIALLFMLPHKELRTDLLGRFFNFKNIKGKYIFITFFIMLISILAAQAISLLFGYPAEQFSIRGSFTFTSSLFPVWFLLLAAPIFEELAWHSYGTDTLVSRFNLLKASLMFALFWAFWHFPLSFIKGYYHSNLVESGWIYSVNFIVSLAPFVLIMNWIYYKTNRNIMLPIVFHITAVFFNEIFATHPMSKVIQTVLLLIVSIYLIIKDKELFCKRI